MGHVQGHGTTALPDRGEVALPTELQQRADADDAADFPDLAPRPAAAPNGGAQVPEGSPQDGPAQGPVPSITDGPPSHRTRSRSRLSRDASAVLAGIARDRSNLLCDSPTRAAALVALIDDAIPLCYNTEAPEIGAECPLTTREALTGPDADEWRAAYLKDLEAKISNGTFTLVPRPKGKRVIPTKVAHSLKRDPVTNSVVELRARWVGKGFRQGPGDFRDTYMATFTATSMRVFFSAVLHLGLRMA